MGHCCLCSIILQVVSLILSVYMSIFWLVYTMFYYLNLRLWHEGTPKYLGESHRLEIWVMENMTGFLHSRRKQ